MSKRNLNEYQLSNDGNYHGNFKDNSTSSNDNKIDVYFRNISAHLIQEIRKADVVVGCVAWLTNSKILDALAKKEAISIIVQKEDFLRPDLGQGKDYMKKWKEKLRAKYNELPGDLDRFMFKNILYDVSTNTLSSIEAVRCVGNYNKSKTPAFPRMHNKFLLFCKMGKRKQTKDSIELTPIIFPYAVWTGSFNFTKTASESLENSLLIRDSRIVEAYFKEFGQICAMSEPLDWESVWVEPTWRIGT